MHGISWSGILFHSRGWAIHWASLCLDMGAPGVFSPWKMKSLSDDEMATYPTVQQ